MDPPASLPKLPRSLCLAAAWGWTLLAGGGGLALLVMRGPLPLTNGWSAGSLSSCRGLRRRPPRAAASGASFSEPSTSGRRVPPPSSWPLSSVRAPFQTFSSRSLSRSSSMGSAKVLPHAGLSPPSSNQTASGSSPSPNVSMSSFVGRWLHHGQRIAPVSAGTCAVGSSRRANRPSSGCAAYLAAWSSCRPRSSREPRPARERL